MKVFIFPGWAGGGGRVREGGNKFTLLNVARYVGGKRAVVAGAAPCKHGRHCGGAARGGRLDRPHVLHEGQPGALHAYMLSS